MTSSAAFFDLDRTLISGASAFPIGIEAWRQDLASNSEVAKWGLAALSFKLLCDKGNKASEEIRGAFLNRIGGSSVAALEGVASAVLPGLVSRVRPESRKLLKMHGEAGRHTWIVSASPEALVAPLAASLGMTGSIATKSKVVDGYYTGELDGPFMYGAGKSRAIEKLASEEGYDLELCYAYSDSISDLPMMEIVGHPVAVNPDSELEALARERGWPIVIFARRTKRAVAFSGAGSGAVIATTVAYLLGRRHGRMATLAEVGKKGVRSRGSR